MTLTEYSPCGQVERLVPDCLYSGAPELLTYVFDAGSRVLLKLAPPLAQQEFYGCKVFLVNSDALVEF